MRWDRIGRVALLIVLMVVAGLYIQDAMSYLATRNQADREQAIVKQLSRQNAALAAEQQSLQDPATVRREARDLGMVLPGERPYVVMNH